MSYGERLGALQQIEIGEALSQGRAPLNINAVELDPNTCGQYLTGTNTEQINAQLLRDDTPDEALATVYHEGRHAYQYSQAQNPAAAKDTELAGQWKENFDNYYKGGIDSLYRNQPVEKDAFEYEQVRMQEYNKGEQSNMNQNYETESEAPVYQPNSQQSVDYESEKPQVYQVSDETALQTNDPRMSYDHIGSDKGADSFMQQQESIPAYTVADSVQGGVSPSSGISSASSESVSVSGGSLGGVASGGGSGEGESSGITY
ncbi:hypothetical protein FACS18949_18290 [Clostridia bacterium]|nr:hypothetical protein FACS18949_18290 [Clostridia bacterium]